MSKKQTIIENLAEIMGEPLPVDLDTAKTLVRKTFKTITQEQTAKLREDAQDYLVDVGKALKRKMALPLPPDYLAEIATATEAVDETDDQASQTDDEAPETLPLDIKCENTAVNEYVETLLFKLEKETLRLPDFQRKFVWKKEERESFIKALISGVPIPNIMIAIDTNHDNDAYILDGFQRLSTMRLFKEGKVLLDGKTFEQQSKWYQNRFLKTVVQTLEVKAERRHWSPIFRCINKGGTALNEVEIRRATYQFPLMVMLDNFTESHTVWATLYGKNTRFRGLDAAFRTYAMHVAWKEYQKPMRQFLDNFCEAIADVDIDVDDLQQKYDSIVMALDAHVTKVAFRISEGKQPNRPMIDCIIHAGLMFLESKPDMDQDTLGKNLNIVRKRLLNVPEVMQALTFDTSGRNSTTVRMEKTESIVTTLLNPVAR